MEHQQHKYEVMNMNKNIRIYTLIAFFAFFMLGSLFADTETSPLADELSKISKQIQDLVPIVALLMLVMAGLIYGIGQVMGAEVRGRAAVWAQALLIGAIIGLMIMALAPHLIQLFSGTAFVDVKETE
jgi:hypothetical protein